MLNISERSVRTAREVIDRGAPELVHAVERGAVSVSAAADVAELPEDEQREVVARGEREILQAAAQIRARKAEARRSDRIAKLLAISSNNAALPTGRRYPLLLADPPWRYEHTFSLSHDIEEHYPTLSVEEVCALPVGELATADVLMLKPRIVSQAD